MEIPFYILPMMIVFWFAALLFALTEPINYKRVPIANGNINTGIRKRNTKEIREAKVMATGTIDFRQFKNKQEAIKYILKMYDATCKNHRQAEKWLYDHIPKESYYQKKIIEWIRNTYPDAFYWKAQAGPYCRQGIPDICCIINGKFYGFEVKRPLVGVLSDIQKETIDQIRKAGGRAHVVSFVEDVAIILQQEGYPHER